MQRTMYVYTLAASVFLALAAPASGGLPHLLALPHSAVTTPRPTNAPGAGFSVRAYVIPDPVSNGARPTLYARTAMGAVCTPSVVYSTGDAPRLFDDPARAVGSSRVVGWTWHIQSSGTGGTATVTCSFQGQTRSAKASFSIV